MINKFILFGGSGFLGQSFTSYLKSKNFDYIKIGSLDINLLLNDNKKQIHELTKYENATYVFFSALTPDKGKDINTFEKNILMAKNFLDNFNYNNLENKQIIYISSDAVYPLSIETISDEILPTPTDLYSAMHLTREIMFKTKFLNNLTIVRPTLIYGFGDTHNSYGPNRFFKQMIADKSIKIFGEGIDMRDHLYISDFCNLIYNFGTKKILGTYNVASGKSISYIELANTFKNLFSNHLSEISKIEVNNKISKRFFDIKNLENKFNFKPSNLENNLQEYFNSLMSD